VGEYESVPVAARAQQQRHGLRNMDTPAANTLAGTITSIETQRRKADRVNVYIDGEFAFGARAETLAKFGLSVGDALTLEDKAGILQADARAAAYESAISLIALRPRSEREIRDRLRRKEYDDAVIDLAVERLLEQRYLDDDAFARYWIENRTSFRPRGELALRNELRAKGVDREIVDETIADAEIDDLALAVELARGKARSMEHLDKITRQRRLIGFLQRRGFGYGVIKTALDELEADNDDSDSMLDEGP
jgi:regulatory protein